MRIFFDGIPRVAGVFLCVAVLMAVFSSRTPAQDTETAAPAPAKLVKAVMCEEIENFEPKNVSVVFSISYGKVCCYTEFDPVIEETYIYHSWFNKDTLISTKRLTLKPPKWSSFSQVQLRGADIGQWRVEIHDQTGKILETLRFSITE